MGRAHLQCLTHLTERPASNIHHATLTRRSAPWTLETVTLVQGIKVRVARMRRARAPVGRHPGPRRRHSSSPSSSYSPSRRSRRDRAAGVRPRLGKVAVPAIRRVPRPRPLAVAVTGAQVLLAQVAVQQRDPAVAVLPLARVRLAEAVPHVAVRVGRRALAAFHEALVCRCLPLSHVS